MTIDRKRSVNRDTQERARQSRYGDIEKSAHNVYRGRHGKRVVVTVPGVPVQVREVSDDVMPSRMSTVPLVESLPAEKWYRG